MKKGLIFTWLMLVVAYAFAQEQEQKTDGWVIQGFLDGNYKADKVYLVEEEIELYRYKDTAPKAYYGCLEASLEMLKNSGVTIASQSQIPDLILHGEPEEGVEPEGPSKDCEVLKKDESCVKEAVLDKRVITEKDMIDLGNNRVRKVTVGEKAILTDLAREYASKHRITVLRRGTSSGKGHSL